MYQKEGALKPFLAVLKLPTRQSRASSRSMWPFGQDILLLLRLEVRR